MSDSTERKVILFADLVDSTPLYQTRGDVRAHDLVTRSLELMQHEIASREGSVLRTVGDAVLASFDSVDQTCDAAIGIQRALEALSVDARVGFHVGDVIPDKGDIYGSAVNLAARVAAHANGGEVFATEAAIAGLSDERRQRCHSLERFHLKGVDDPTVIFRIDWRESDPLTRVHVPKDDRGANHHAPLLLLDANGARHVVRADSGDFTIGRAVDSLLLIDHESTSRCHATIEYRGGRYLLKDRSTNGTYLQIDGRPVIHLRREEISLEGEGEIGFGWLPTNADEPLRIHYRLAREEDAMLP